MNIQENTPTSQPETALERLLQTARTEDSSEAQIKADVKSLFDALTQTNAARLEVSVEGGSIDILIRNTIVEVKKDGNRLGTAPPWAIDQQTRRQYAATQLQDYVNARYSQVSDSKSIYYGFTTNGTLWHRWEVQVGGDAPKQVKTYDLSQAHLQDTDRHGRTRKETIYRFLEELHLTIDTLPPPPQDFSQLLADFPKHVEDIALKSLDEPEFETKRLLWEDLMRGAFIVKPENQEKNIELFAHHSLLVEIARRVAFNVANDAYELPMNDVFAFSSWLKNHETGHKNTAFSAELKNLVRNLHSEIDRYNWRLSSMDVLKHVYQSFIPKDVRHDFGEYYTPDWLAEAICEHVLDDAWCTDAVRRAADPDDDLNGIGVLEPACGSGTFLRAAVNRLKPFAEMQTNDKVEQSNMICRLVHGLDIHPVAVELARSTMLAALPGLPTGGESALRIFLADTLQWITSTDLRLISGDDLLLEAPPDATGNPRMILIPSEVLLSPRFNEIVDDIVRNSARTQVLHVRLRQMGLDDANVIKLLDCAQVINELKQEGKNHIWGWFIKNIAQPQRLMRAKLDRMVGNPPWITQNDLSEERQSRHVLEAQSALVWVGGKQAPNNDLAALFVSSTARNYMSRQRQWRMGMVLPYSALRSGQWEKFRSGQWYRLEHGDSEDRFDADMSQPPWDLKMVHERPFEQADSCVVFAQNPAGPARKLSRTKEIWHSNDLIRSMQWQEVDKLVERHQVNDIVESASDYLEVTRRGADLFPATFILIEKGTIESGGAGVIRFRTARSRHAPWAGNQQIGQVEERCVRRAVLSADIAPHRVFGETHAVLPADEVFSADNPYLEIAKSLLFDDYWVKVDTIWRKLRKPRSPETLLLNINHMNKLSTQIGTKHPVRVVYPRSGSNFFGAWVDESVIVDTGCYYIPVHTDIEARYLCAVFGAPVLNVAFKLSRRSDRDFHKYPLRTVPVPEFNASNELHTELADLGHRAESVADQVPIQGRANKMRSAIRDALRDDGVSNEIDRCVRELLPGYAEN